VIGSLLPVPMRVSYVKLRIVTGPIHMTIYTDNTGDGLGAPTATASDTISGVDYPEMKIVLGAAGTAVLASAGQGTQDTGTLRVAVATAGTPKFATLQLSATGEVVAAVSGKKIRVLAARLSAAGTVNTKWQSASTDKTGLLAGSRRSLEKR
jgi:hypothetical protein